MVVIFFSFMCKLHGTFVILENVVSNGVSLGSITPIISNLDQLRVLHHFISTELDGLYNGVLPYGSWHSLKFI